MSDFNTSVSNVPLRQKQCRNTLLRSLASATSRGLERTFIPKEAGRLSSEKTIETTHQEQHDTTFKEKSKGMEKLAEWGPKVSNEIETHVEAVKSRPKETKGKEMVDQKIFEILEELNVTGKQEKFVNVNKKFPKVAETQEKHAILKREEPKVTGILGKRSILEKKESKRTEMKDNHYKLRPEESNETETPVQAVRLKLNKLKGAEMLDRKIFEILEELTTSKMQGNIINVEQKASRVAETKEKCELMRIDDSGVALETNHVWGGEDSGVTEIQQDTILGLEEPVATGIQKQDLSREEAESRVTEPQKQSSSARREKLKATSKENLCVRRKVSREAEAQKQLDMLGLEKLKELKTEKLDLLGSKNSIETGTEKKLNILGCKKSRETEAPKQLDIQVWGNSREFETLKQPDISEWEKSRANGTQELRAIWEREESGATGTQEQQENLKADVTSLTKMGKYPSTQICKESKVNKTHKIQDSVRPKESRVTEAQGQQPKIGEALSMVTATQEQQPRIGEALSMVTATQGQQPRLGEALSRIAPTEEQPRLGEAFSRVAPTQGQQPRMVDALSMVTETQGQRLRLGEALSSVAPTQGQRVRMGGELSRENATEEQRSRLQGELARVTATQEQHATFRRELFGATGIEEHQVRLGGELFRVTGTPEEMPIAIESARFAFAATSVVAFQELIRRSETWMVNGIILIAMTTFFILCYLCFFHAFLPVAFVQTRVFNGLVTLWCLIICIVIKLISYFYVLRSSLETEVERTTEEGVQTYLTLIEIQSHQGNQFLNNLFARVSRNSSSAAADRRGESLNSIRAAGLRHFSLEVFNREVNRLQLVSENLQRGREGRNEYNRNVSGIPHSTRTLVERIFNSLSGQRRLDCWARVRAVIQVLSWNLLERLCFTLGLRNW